MSCCNRREFLTDVGRGALIASLGPSLVCDLGLGRCLADDAAGRIDFGDLEPLAALMQETPIDKLLPKVVAEIREGATASRIVAAAALANARALGGEDYIGYHAQMALAPAFAMAGRNPAGRDWLPILKVVYRNTDQIQSKGRGDHDALAPLAADPAAGEPPTGEELRERIRMPDGPAAEAAFARMVDADPKKAYCALQMAIQDDVNVHRVVLAWRAWALLPLTGGQNAQTMLRQCVRFCVESEEHRISKGHPEPAIRAALPRLLDQYKLEGRALGRRDMDDSQVEALASAIHQGTQESAAEAAAAALADGFSPAAVAEAMAVAANRLVLFDPGRPEKWSSANKPPGSVHGDSVGVHAADAANAWRNIAQVGDARTTITSLIVGAYHTGGQQKKDGARIATPDDVAAVKPSSPEDLLRETESAIRGKDQRRASAAAQRYGELGLPAEPMFALLRRFSTTEDGALHAEKFYQTAAEEFAAVRPAFRWDQVVALARVNASQFGYPAPGLDEAAKLLG